MIVRVNWLLATERLADDLTAAIRDHLVDVHVELRSTARHPDMQRKHVVMLAGEDLIAHLCNQRVESIVETFAGVIGIGRCLLEERISRDHFPWHQVAANAEMLN